MNILIETGDHPRIEVTHSKNAITFFDLSLCEAILNQETSNQTRRDILKAFIDSIADQDEYSENNINHLAHWHGLHLLMNDKNFSDNDVASHTLELFQKLSQSRAHRIQILINLKPQTDSKITQQNFFVTLTKCLDSSCVTIRKMALSLMLNFTLVIPAYEKNFIGNIPTIFTKLSKFIDQCDEQQKIHAIQLLIELIPESNVACVILQSVSNIGSHLSTLLDSTNQQLLEKTLILISQLTCSQHFLSRLKEGELSHKKIKDLQLTYQSKSDVITCHASQLIVRFGNPIFIDPSNHSHRIKDINNTSSPLKRKWSPS